MKSLVSLRDAEKKYGMLSRPKTLGQVRDLYVKYANSDYKFKGYAIIMMR